MIEKDTTICRTVLLVEDELLVAMLMEQILREEGYELMGPASTVAAALDILGDNPEIGAALLDVNLHDERVAPVAEALECRGIPFAFVTGYEGSEIVSRYPDRPVLTKPFELAEMLAVVTGLLRPVAH